MGGTVVLTVQEMSILLGRLRGSRSLAAPLCTDRSILARSRSTTLCPPSHQWSCSRRPIPRSHGRKRHCRHGRVSVEELARVLREPKLLPQLLASIMVVGEVAMVVYRRWNGVCMGISEQRQVCPGLVDGQSLTSGCPKGMHRSENVRRHSSVFYPCVTLRHGCCAKGKLAGVVEANAEVVAIVRPFGVLPSE